MATEIPKDLKDILSEVQLEGTLPSQRGLIKYDYTATLGDLFYPALVLALPFVIYGFNRIKNGTTLGDLLSGPIWLSIIYLGLFITTLFIGIALFGDWLDRRTGKKFILLTPKYLVNVCGSVEHFEWKDIGDLCVTASGQLHGKNIQVNEPIHKLDNFNIFMHENEIAALNGGHRELAFNHRGDKKSIHIPDGVDIKTLSSFIRTYWIVVNPSAKRKDILYL